MDFKVNGSWYSLEPDVVRARVTAVPPDPIRVHWIEIDGRRWPPKQAFRIATATPDADFTTHMALRVFQRLGFATSPIPQGGGSDVAPAAPRARPRGTLAAARPVVSRDAAQEAFTRLDDYLAAQPLTERITALESALHGADHDIAARALADSGLSNQVVEDALIVRERIGVIDSLLHATVIARVLPLILEPGEELTRRPSLGAGNDPDRIFDVETTLRVAEFKVSSWKGRDSMRQRGLFADVVGLAMDTSGRRRQVFVVGEVPVRFLTKSSRNALKTLSKAALRVREVDGLDDTTTVSAFTREAGIEVIDLTTLIPSLR